MLNKQKKKKISSKESTDINNSYHSNSLGLETLS